jgi:hypothetical protein
LIEFWRGIINSASANQGSFVSHTQTEPPMEKQKAFIYNLKYVGKNPQGNNEIKMARNV